MKKYEKLKDFIMEFAVYLAVIATIGVFLLILGHIVSQSYPAWTQLGAKELFALSGEWRPTSAEPRYSILPAVCGTLYVSFLAVLLTLVFGVAASVFLVFYVSNKASHLFFAFIGMLAGVPSVIFGFVGLTVLVKWLLNHSSMSSGQCVLAAGIVLGAMLLPFVISTCSETMKLLREEYLMMTYSLGMSRESFIVHVVLPSMRKSIVAAVMMAFGRGLGETMAVMMVIGNSNIFPHLLGRGQTIPAMTALEMGSIGYGSMHLSVLYAANLVLLVILFLVIGIGEIIQKGIRMDEK